MVNRPNTPDDPFDSHSERDPTEHRELEDLGLLGELLIERLVLRDWIASRTPDDRGHGSREDEP